MDFCSLGIEQEPGIGIADIKVPDFLLGRVAQNHPLGYVCPSTYLPDAAIEHIGHFRRF